MNSPTTLRTSHGDLRLPVYLPDATRAVVKALSTDDLEACGIEVLCTNTFHLSTKPGVSVVQQLGGVHRFMGWKGPVFTDSGGFQIFSLLGQKGSGAKVSRDGFAYRTPQGKDVKLTAEKSIQLQWKLGSDVVVCLDHCTHPAAPADDQRTSVENTVRWARECRSTFDRLVDQRRDQDTPAPLLFAVVQGGEDHALRRECAERLLEIGFDGYGFGGWPVHDDGRLRDEVALTAELLGRDKVMWGLGIGSPDNLRRSFAAGYRVFDCALPTRDGRQGRLLVGPDEDAEGLGRKNSRGETYSYLHIQDEYHLRSDSPISNVCDCLTCRRFSRGYLNHLYAIEDPAAARLGTIHNLRFYMRLIESLRSESPAEASGAESPPAH